MRRLVRALLCVVTLTGCSDALTQPENGAGSFEGRWNGRTWKGRGFAVLISDTLHLVGHLRPNRRSFYDEYVRVYTPFRGEGSYTIESGYAELAIVVGGDAGWSPSARGVMTLTDIDPAGTRVLGGVDLVSTRASLDWKFEDGRFELPIHSSFQDGYRALGNLGVPRFPF